MSPMAITSTGFVRRDRLVREAEEERLAPAATR